jgi:hypothetical protein
MEPFVARFRRMPPQAFVAAPIRNPSTSSFYWSTILYAHYVKPRYRILRDGDEKSTLLLGDEIIAKFNSNWDCGIGHSDVCYLAQAASNFESLVAAVHATLGMLPEMKLPGEKTSQLRKQLEKAIADAMQEPQIMDMNKLEQRRTELVSKLEGIPGQPPSDEPSVKQEEQKMREELDEAEYLLRYC